MVHFPAHHGADDTGGALCPDRILYLQVSLQRRGAALVLRGGELQSANAKWVSWFVGRDFFLDLRG